MITKTNRKMERARRHARVRRKISGTAERPRLCVYRSNTNLYVQVIDDVAGKTLVSASTLDKEVKTKYANKEAAKEVVEDVKDVMKDIKDMTLTELKEVAKIKGIKGYSKLKKDELLEVLK